MAKAKRTGKAMGKISAASPAGPGAGTIKFAGRGAVKRAGRPAGSKTRPKQSETVTLSTCAKCGSTDREEYHGKREVEIAGVDPATGKHYTHVVWRRTRCKHCGQVRIDRTLENRQRKETRG